MIKKLKYLKDFGIFQDFSSPPNLADFNKFNLFYGWNGCGKTTLSRLFQALESKSLEDSFPESKFEFIISDNTALKNSTLESFSSPIYIFNKHFIDKNIDWNKQGAKTIVIISEDNIEDRKRFFELKNTIVPTANSLVNVAAKTLETSIRERDVFLTNQARNIKLAFKLIDTNDTRYLNYNRDKLKDYIKGNQTILEQGKGILEDDKLAELSKQVRPIQKPEIIFSFPNIDNSFKECILRIEGLLNQTVVSKTIKHLQNHSDINSWVHEGLSLHRNHGSEVCEFCLQDLPNDRLSDLEAHFSKAYIDLVDSLNSEKERLILFKRNYTPIDKSELYEELQGSYQMLLEELMANEKMFNDYLTIVEKSIEYKLKNLFSTSVKIEIKPHVTLEDLIKSQDKVQSILKEHNQRTQNFEKGLVQYKALLEGHYVAEGLKENNYFNLLKRIDNEEVHLNRCKSNLEIYLKELGALEANLASASGAAVQFNKYLHEFLGRDEITLRYDALLKGYKIVRAGGNNPAKHLSEGEKTAIAFVYFLTKIRENGNQIGQSIVVIDDPISSFDSNHLHLSFSFLKTHFEDVFQLFVLTHNFHYFKLVRDWMLKKNKYGREPKSSFFTIVVDKGAVRKSSISNAHESLLKYGSEYHFVYKKLTEYRIEASLDAGSSFQVANFSRKLLEAFFAFKHPKYRNDFAQLMQVGCDKAGISAQTREKVYRFINKYSHYQVIDFEDNAVDNILAESENITNAVFEILRAADEVHFKEMEEVSLN